MKGKKEMNITAKIEQVYFTGNHWASIRVVTPDGTTYKAAGVIDAPVEGYNIEMDGEMTVHQKYGKHFKVSASRIIRTESFQGLINYLSKFVKNVGPALALKIADEFGSKSYDIIENNPKALTGIPGISEKKAMKIHISHMENKSYSELAEYLGEKATPNQIQRIYSEFGKNGLAAIKNNPYIIIYRVDGIGFKIADKLALSSGISRNDPRRVGAAIIYLLKNIASEGHCFCRVENLEGMLKKMFGSEIPTEEIGQVLAEELKAERLVLVDDDKLYWQDIYKAEIICAECINAMLRSHPTHPFQPATVKAAIDEMESEIGYTLSERQKDAVVVPMRNRLSVVTGGPGCGKTTIIRAQIKAWKKTIDPFGLNKKADDSIFLCAPAAKAARRMTQATGLKAYTVHQIVFHMRDKLKDALIIVDEASMLDIVIASYLLAATKDNCTIIFAGDADQLDPIGPGNIFKDMIRSPLVPTVTLDVSHRMCGSINKNAKRINNGQSIHAYDFDDSFRFIPAEKDTVQKAMLDTYFEQVKKFGVKDVVCISPKRETGQTASKTLNMLSRENLNSTDGGNEIPGCFYRINDRVMYLDNNKAKDIYNGDCGTITHIDPVTKDITVELDDERVVTLTSAETGSMMFAYAMTAHKSQGSEFQAVIISQCWEDYRMLSRALLYTAVTRAKAFVAIVGEKRAIDAALRNVESKIRNTRLPMLIGRQAA